jgi:hypothetical protein
MERKLAEPVPQASLRARQQIVDDAASIALGPVRALDVKRVVRREPVDRASEAMFAVGERHIQVSLGAESRGGRHGVERMLAGDGRLPRLDLVRELTGHDNVESAALCEARATSWISPSTFTSLPRRAGSTKTGARARHDFAKLRDTLHLFMPGRAW